jgi:hypothetical protein
LKKVTIFAAMLALVLTVAVPAIAQVSQEFNQEIAPTGDVTLTTNISSSGDNGNQCVAPLQFGNTGNIQNAQGFLQYGGSDQTSGRHHKHHNNGSSVGDVQFEGSSFEFTPSLTNTCEQTVQQAAAAGGN